MNTPKWSRYSALILSQKLLNDYKLKLVETEGRLTNLIASHLSIQLLALRPVKFVL